LALVVVGAGVGGGYYFYKKKQGGHVEMSNDEMKQGII